MWGELRQHCAFRLSLPDGKYATWPLQEHESKISEIAPGLDVAGNRISSILHRLLPLREVRILSIAAHPLLFTRLQTPPKIVPSGLPEVNLTLLFPLHCLIGTAPNICTAAIAYRISLRWSRHETRPPYLHPPSSCHPESTHTLIQSQQESRDYRHV